MKLAISIIKNEVLPPENIFFFIFSIDTTSDKW